MTQQTNPMIKSFFLLCKKKIRKKKKKSRAALFFSFGCFLGEIDRVSLSLSKLSPRPSPPRRRRRRLEGTAFARSSYHHRLERSRLVVVLGFSPFFRPRRERLLLLLLLLEDPKCFSRERIEKSYRVLDPNNNTKVYGTRKTNAGPSFETDKTTTTTLKNTNDDYDILYSTLCLNCAFVAANCVVADETANMVFGICDEDDDARWRSKKNGEFSRKKNEDFV